MVKEGLSFWGWQVNFDGMLSSILIYLPLEGGCLDVGEIIEIFLSFFTVILLFFVQMKLDSNFSCMPESGQFVALLEASYPILKTEWEAFKNLGDASFKEV